MSATAFAVRHRHILTCPSHVLTPSSHALACPCPCLPWSRLSHVPLSHVPTCHWMIGVILTPFVPPQYEIASSYTPSAPQGINESSPAFSAFFYLTNLLD